MSLARKPTRGSGGAIPLTSNQRRVITTSLRLLEEQLVACRNVVDGAGAGTRLVVHRNRFSREARDDLIGRLDSLLAMITRMSEEIGVDPAVVSVPSLLSAILSSAWETLEELRPNRLKGYGAVDPTADLELTAFVEATTEEIRGILDTARRYRRHEAPVAEALRDERDRNTGTVGMP